MIDLFNLSRGYNLMLTSFKVMKQTSWAERVETWRWQGKITYILITWGEQKTEWEILTIHTSFEIINCPSREKRGERRGGQRQRQSNLVLWPCRINGIFCSFLNLAEVSNMWLTFWDQQTERRALFCQVNLGRGHLWVTSFEMAQGLNFWANEQILFHFHYLTSLFSPSNVATRLSVSENCPFRGLSFQYFLAVGKMPPSPPVFTVQILTSTKLLFPPSKNFCSLSL